MSDHIEIMRRTAAAFDTTVLKQEIATLEGMIGYKGRLLPFLKEELVRRLASLPRCGGCNTTENVALFDMGNGISDYVCDMCLDKAFGVVHRTRAGETEEFMNALADEQRPFSYPFLLTETQASVVAAILAEYRKRVLAEMPHAILDSEIRDSMHVFMYLYPRNPEFSEYALTIQLLSLLLSRAIRLKEGEG